VLREWNSRIYTSINRWQILVVLNRIQAKMRYQIPKNKSFQKRLLDQISVCYKICIWIYYVEISIVEWNFDVDFMSKWDCDKFVILVTEFHLEINRHRSFMKQFLFCINQESSFPRRFRVITESIKSVMLYCHSLDGAGSKMRVGWYKQIRCRFQMKKSVDQISMSILSRNLVDLVCRDAPLLYYSIYFSK